MKYFTWLFALPIAFACKNNLQYFPPTPLTKNASLLEIDTKRISDTTSWEYFLQHLPEEQGPVVTYKGETVRNQEKHFSIISYDVGTKDLQQCADALIRLRAEYLFQQKRYSDIGFHFTSGDLYRFTDYCQGKIPVPKGNDVAFVSSVPQPQTKPSLRKYLDIVYTYAGTISLASKLNDADDFSIGTVVISPGSPGHCFMITNEATTPSGEKLYKLVEGYTPAQSIYVLNNTNDPALGCWHSLKKGTITTASYEFTSYKLKQFE
jgi:hypothetical protein